MSHLPSRVRLATLPPHAERLRPEVKAFLQSALEPTPAPVRARCWMGFDAGFSRRLAARGWVGVTFPAQFGGANLDAFSRYVLVEEPLAAGAPVSAHWIADRQSGPPILKFGAAAQQAFYLPRICLAEALFCIGMRAPNSGSDPASVSTRAQPVQSGWVLNGRKILTSCTHRCQYMIALVRSSGDQADRQAGLSQFIVDLSRPGVTVRPIRDRSGDAHFSEVLFDNVRLAPDALLGPVGSGFAPVNALLAFELSTRERIYSRIALLEHWIVTLRARKANQTHAATAGRAPSPLAAASAKSRASEAAALVAATAHAGHRAIGMTDECELGVLTRRLHEWRLSYGAGHYRNQIIGAQLLASASSAVDFARAAWCADAVGSATLVPCQ